MPKDGPFPRYPGFGSQTERADGGAIQPCAGRYSAQQVPGLVIVRAEGMHPTSGYQVILEQTPPDVFPPEFALWHIKPTGTVLDVVTPFQVQRSFPASATVSAIRIHDASGVQDVKVEQVPDSLKTHR
jgi:hypothetical protein